MTMANPAEKSAPTPSMAVSDRQVIKQAARTGDVVYIACKYPNGLRLEIFQKCEEYEQTPLGRKPMVVHRRTGEFFIARGPRHEHGVIPTYPIISGFAVTPGCPADLWARYVEQNKDADYIRNHVLFAGKTLDEITAKCREHSAVRSGFEPLDMTTKNAQGRLADPRVPRTVNPAVTGVSTADESNKPAVTAEQE